MHRTPAAVDARARHAVLCRLSHVGLPACKGGVRPTGFVSANEVAGFRLAHLPIATGELKEDGGVSL